MYLIEPIHNWHKSTIDARGSDTPLLAASILAVILRLFNRFLLIFLTKMPSYVSNIMKNNVLINESPLNDIDAKSNFHSYGYDYPKNWYSHIPRTISTYLDRSCIGFLAQVSGHTMLRKREIKIALLNMISTLSYI